MLEGQELPERGYPQSSGPLHLKQQLRQQQRQQHCQDHYDDCWIVDGSPSSHYLNAYFYRANLLRANQLSLVKIHCAARKKTWRRVTIVYMGGDFRTRRGQVVMH